MHCSCHSSVNSPTKTQAEFVSKMFRCFFIHLHNPRDHLSQMKTEFCHFSWLWKWKQKPKYLVQVQRSKSVAVSPFLTSWVLNQQNAWSAREILIDDSWGGNIVCELLMVVCHMGTLAGSMEDVKFCHLIHHFNGNAVRRRLEKNLLNCKIYWTDTFSAWRLIQLLTHLSVHLTLSLSSSIKYTT